MEYQLGIAFSQSKKKWTLKGPKVLWLEIILGQDYTNFEEVTQEGNIKTMKQVREKYVNFFLKKINQKQKIQKKGF